ncbi:uncharacterized protein LOC126761334 [Bactrocera neohumeralis]|uniref:uncharacterized protein LOC126761334 n=1 Tax=Bactrocera neohumeralis TaxID=98809 RepID=UPI002165AE72|nr:uncharacterized protein LOC126761334 [Bactrocera neohumeralis]
MTSRDGIFSEMPPSFADLTEAVEKIEMLIARKKLKSKLFYDMLLGFRMLEEALQYKQSEAYELVIRWTKLFLKIQSNLTNQHDGIRRQFEKVVPPAITYIIGCLQYKTKAIISYHYQLLEMIHELLLNLRPGVLENLATFETGVIACVWFPIGFVGDFNTQLLALRLLAMLLKCVDPKRLQNELNSIRCADKSVLKNKLTAAIAVANFHTAKFENTARDLLNTYNMHLAKNILVYSFRCKSFKFGENINFFKPLNVENFWIDFNYCPRTLSFNGRCQTNTKAIYTNCSASLKITKLSLNNLTLTVHFQAPVQIFKETSDLPDVSQITTAKIIIPRDEAMRLLENEFILKYFNESPLPNLPNKISSFAKPINISTPLSSSQNTEKTVGSKTNKGRNDYRSLENKENISPEEGITDTRSETSNKKKTSKQFQKSYEILIGIPKSNNEKTNEKRIVSNTKDKTAKSTENLNFQLPHLLNLQKEFEDDLSKNTRSRSTHRKIVNYSTSTSESLTSSQISTNPLNENAKPSRKRFFKTQIYNSDADYVPNKTKRVSRPRNARNARQKSSNTSINKMKKINEVKPMLYSNQELTKIVANTCTSHFAEEVSTNLNEHLPNSTTVEQLSNYELNTNVYEDLTVSDAEPGQSYRNFRIRRNPFDDENTNNEVKRPRTKPRNSLPRTIKTKGQLVVRSIKPGAEKTLDPFDAAKNLKITQSKVQQPEEAEFTNKNLTVYSTDIDVCSTTKQSLNDAVGCKRKLYDTETLNVEKALPIGNTVRNEYEISKAVVQTLEKASTNDAVKEIEICNNLPVPAIDAELNVEEQVDDIQDCRQDVSQIGINNVCDYDEFSDFPTFSTLLDISDMCLSPERQSNNDLTQKATQQAGTNLALSTKSKSPVLMDYANKLESKKSIIYCSRSENDSDSEQSTISNNNRELSVTQTLELPLQRQQHVFLTPQLPLQNFRKTTSLTKCQVTNTGTSVITQQDSFIHKRKFVVNLAASTNAPLNLSKTSSRITATTTTKAVVEENSQVNVNSPIQRNGSFTAPTPKALLQESADMIASYNKNLNIHLDQIETSIGSNSANAYIEKICDIGESMINEIERERKSLWELEVNAERLSRQLGWQYEAYQRKHQQFQCFKQNIDDLLRILSNINLSEEIENDAKHKIEKLLQTSNYITGQEWRNFVNESTENLLKDISSLSNL